MADHESKWLRRHPKALKSICVTPYSFDQHRLEAPRYSRRVEMAEIEKNGFNLNISRYISTAVGEADIDLAVTHAALVETKKTIAAAKQKHNQFLTESGLKPLP